MNYYAFSDFKLIKQAFNQYAREQKQNGWVKTLVPGSTQHNIVDYLPFFTISLWDYYQFSGDRQTLSDLYDSVSKSMKVDDVHCGRKRGSLPTGRIFGYSSTGVR